MLTVSTMVKLTGGGSGSLEAVTRTGSTSSLAVSCAALDKEEVSARVARREGARIALSE
jgi:hypothetical protein